MTANNTAGHEETANSNGSEVDQRLQQLADMIPQLVWITDANGYHEYYNRRWYEYTGLTYEQTKGEGWNSVLHPADQKRAFEIWTKSLQSGADYEIEYRFRRSDGMYRWFLGRALPLKDENGKITKWFGTCTDIHEQKINRDQLEGNKSEMEGLMSFLPQLIWVAGADGSVHYFNDRISHYAGAVWKPDGTWNWEGLVHPEDQERTVAQWSACVRSGRPYEMQYRLRMSDGSYRWHLARAAAQLDFAGRPMKWYGSCTDIHSSMEAAGG